MLQGRITLREFLIANQLSLVRPISRLPPLFFSSRRLHPSIRELIKESAFFWYISLLQTCNLKSNKPVNQLSMARFIVLFYLSTNTWREDTRLSTSSFYFLLTIPMVANLPSCPLSSTWKVKMHRKRKKKKVRWFLISARSLFFFYAIGHRKRLQTNTRPRAIHCIYIT